MVAVPVINAPFERNLHAAGRFEPVVEVVGQRADRILQLRMVDQVHRLVGVFLQVEELVGVPDAVVTDVFVGSVRTPKTVGVWGNAYSQ